MQNTLTKTKRPRIQSKPLPIYTETINQRMSKVCNKLGIKTEYVNKQVKIVLTDDQRMEKIRQQWSTIN